MYEATFQAHVDDPWRSMAPIRVGPIPLRQPEPQYVTVRCDGAPFARIDVYANYQGTFSKVITWGRFVAIGLDDAAYLVDPDTCRTRAIPCKDYFGDFDPRADRLLVTSASELICVSENGEVQWRCADLAIDGVVIERIEDSVIIGRGEWDPPGGWQPFSVSLDNGTLLSGAKDPWKSTSTRPDQPSNTQRHAITNGAKWILIILILLAVAAAVFVGLIIKWTREALPPVDRL